MLADLAIPLIALAVLLLIPEAPMPTIDPATGLPVPDATLGGPIPAEPDPAVPTADPIAVPDSPPPPEPGTTNPDTGIDDGTGPTAVPTPTPTETDPARPKQVSARDVIARGATVDHEVSILEGQQADIAARLTAKYAEQAAVEKGIASVVGTNPDGFLSKDAEGKVILITKTSGGRGFNITHPSPDDTMVDDPFAAS